MLYRVTIKKVKIIAPYLSAFSEYSLAPYNASSDTHTLSGIRHRRSSYISCFSFYFRHTLSVFDLSLESPYQDQAENVTRVIELQPQISQYKIEDSTNGTDWTVLENVSRECSNGYYEYCNGIQARFIRVTGIELPYGQALRISGLRVFGNSEGNLPGKAKSCVHRATDRRRAVVTWNKDTFAQGHNVRYGTAPDKLYCSWMVYDEDSVELTTLISGQDHYLCVDSFNENRIVKGDLIHID